MCHKKLHYSKNRNLKLCIYPKSVFYQLLNIFLFFSLYYYITDTFSMAVLKTIEHSFSKMPTFLIINISIKNVFLVNFRISFLTFQEDSVTLVSSQSSGMFIPTFFFNTLELCSWYLTEIYPSVYL